jgi:heme exporter protein D
MTTLTTFFYMQGYGIFVFPAYFSVMLFLFMQWLIPWRRWKRYLRTQQSQHE